MIDLKPDLRNKFYRLSLHLRRQPVPDFFSLEYMSHMWSVKTEEEKKLKKMGDPQKRAFLSFEIKTIKKYFFIFFFCFIFKNNRSTNIILISILENAQKKRY